MLAIVAALLVAAVGALHLDRDVNLTEPLDLWLVLLIALASFGVGGCIGLFVASRFMPSENPSARSIYFDHFESVIDSILNGDVTLAGFPTEMSPRVGRAFCDALAVRIKRVTNQDVDVLMLVETNRQRAKRFEVVFASDQIDVEANPFTFKVKRTWLHYIAVQTKGTPQTGHDSPVRKINDLKEDSAYGDDIDVFIEQGYHSLRTCAVHVDKKPLRLVVLSKTPRMFTEQDDDYLELLYRALQVAVLKSKPEPSGFVPRVV